MQRYLASTFAVLLTLGLVACGESTEEAYQRGYDTGYDAGWVDTCGEIARFNSDMEQALRRQGIC